MTPGGGDSSGRAGERLRPAPLSLAHDRRVPPRGAEEARPARRRPPYGGMAAAPRSGGRRRSGAVLLQLLMVLLLAGTAGAGQRSKWRLPVLLVSAGSGAGRCGDGRSERVRAGGRGCSARPPRAGRLRSGASLPGPRLCGAALGTGAGARGRGCLLPRLSLLWRVGGGGRGEKACAVK